MPPWLRSILTAPMRFDLWLLHRGDALVLWAWNERSIPRIALVRGSLIAWVITFVAHSHLHDGDVGWIVWTMAFVLLTLHAFQEWYAATVPAWAQCLATINRRYGGWAIFVRHWGYGNLAVNTALTVLVGEYDAGDVSLLLNLVVNIGFLILMDSLTPLDPPQPRVRETVPSTTDLELAT